MGKIFVVLMLVTLLAGCSLFQAKQSSADRTTQSTTPSVTMEGNHVYSKTPIEFENGTTTLTKDSKAAIGEVASFLKTNSNAYQHLLIEAHTDKMPTLNESMELSHRYALAVKEELARNGVPTEKIDTKGYGFTRPKSSVGLLGRDRLPSQMAGGVDRRIEFVVVK